jgi:YVTN family beta-propeller protein
LLAAENPKGVSIVCLRFVVIAAIVACLSGCGGGGSGGSQSAAPIPPRVVIRWAARSRDLIAPSSALSAVVTFVHASPDGSDASFVVNRRQDPAAYAALALSPPPVLVGATLLTVHFYAQDNGNGAVVGQADAEVRVQSDGSLVKPDGSALGDISTYGSIAAVEVPPGQSVLVGQDLSISFTVRDAAGNVLAVTPGSAIFTLSGGGEFLSVNASGNAHGKAQGAATVDATVDGIRSPSVFVIVATPLQLRRLNLRTNDIAFDAKSARLFASVPSADTTGHGNSIVAIDPSTATITATVFVGSEPNRIAISDDGHFLYVGIDGAAAVRRVDLQSMTADLQFSLGADPYHGSKFCGDIAVMPGSPHTVAVSMRYNTVSPNYADLAIFDDGVKRRNVLTSTDGPFVYWIAFGAASDRIYGFDGAFSSTALSRIAVDASGVNFIDHRTNVINSGNQIRYIGGALYTTRGHVVDPETYTLLGTYDLGSDDYGGATNGFTVDLAANRAYYLVSGGYNTYLTLREFDRSQFLRVSAKVIPISSDYYDQNVVPRMELCGGGTLAFITRGGRHPELGQVVIVSPEN